MATYIYAPTLTPARTFSAEEDSETLKGAMRGLGTDEQKIIDLLAKRASFQRAEIAVQYKSMYGSDLVDDLKGELSGDFERVIVALMTPTSEFLAKEIKEAIDGAGTDEETLIEVITPMTNRELKSLKVAYERLYETPLEDALTGDTSGELRRLLVALLQARRDESRDVDRSQAKDEAQELVDAGEASWGTDESKFISLLATRSFAQLGATYAAYNELAGKTIEEAIDNEFTGSVQFGLLSIVKISKNVDSYFAERLNAALSGGGTDERTLTRIIVTRCEMDLKLVKREFEKTYGRTLEEGVENDTSGDYKKILLALLN